MNKHNKSPINDLWGEKEGDNQHPTEHEEIENLVYSQDLGSAKNHLTDYLRVKGFDEKTALDMVYKIGQYITEQKYTKAINLALTKPK